MPRQLDAALGWSEHQANSIKWWPYNEAAGPLPLVLPARDLKIISRSHVWALQAKQLSRAGSVPSGRCTGKSEVLEEAQR